MNKIHYIIRRYISVREKKCKSTEYWRKRLERKGIYDVCEYGNIITYFKSMDT